MVIHIFVLGLEDVVLVLQFGQYIFEVFGGELPEVGQLFFCGVVLHAIIKDGSPSSKYQNK